MPQGSVLGPLLFAILISDINIGVITSSLLSYADDRKIFKAIEQLGDIPLLQDDLATLYSWSVVNNQDYNQKKFESMSYSSSGMKSLYFDPSHGPIQSKEHVKDLGVTFSADATFNKHIDIITGKARTLSGWMLRTFQSRNKEVMITLLRQLIIPTVEYCCPVWSPGDSFNINKLEKIQRSFTKHIVGMHEVHYWDRLAQLHLYSLQRRRERYMINYIWKIIQGLVPDVGLAYAPTNNNDHIKLKLPHLNGPAHIKKLMKSSLLYHGARLYNNLPGELRSTSNPEEAVSVDTFKRRLDQFIKLMPDEPGPNKDNRIRPAESNSLMHQMAFQRTVTILNCAPKSGSSRAGKRSRAHASEKTSGWKMARSRWDD